MRGLSEEGVFCYDWNLQLSTFEGEGNRKETERKPKGKKEKRKKEKGKRYWGLWKFFHWRSRYSSGSHIFLGDIGFGLLGRRRKGLVGFRGERITWAGGNGFGHGRGGAGGFGRGSRDRH